ncbi:MAG: glycosyl hydrolase family 8 [Cytophagaceae bacterium]
MKRQFSCTIPGKAIFCLVVFLFGITSAVAQVPVDINSGNPRFPFPQFKDYPNGLRTLASENSPGVTHAEMEQRMRDAWQIMANRLEYTGDNHAGVQYIIGNIGCPYDCSEGCGYALLAAAEMADKTTFDGLWMRTHDVRMVTYPRYRDCVVPNPGYQFGPNSLADNVDAATDGSFDIALALLVAWKQWGEFMGINDACGNPISYKQEALNVIKGLVEVYDRGLGDCRRVSGSVGFDGYVKNGNTWGEITPWATGQDPCPEFQGPQFMYIDYVAPAYFNCFAEFLENEGDGDLTWEIDQLRRAEASSDWLIGYMHNEGLVPIAGQAYHGGGANFTFGSFMPGEDFRLGWRTILNPVWNGDPTTTWNPNTHQIEPGGNTFERDMGLRFAEFLKRPQDWGQPCDDFAAPEISFEGPPTIRHQYAPDGTGEGAFTLNWLHGAGSAAAIIAQDFDLMGEMFRQCVIEWDGTVGYLESRPVYFHGFFRLLGMLTLSGNHHSPCDHTPTPNLKVYKAVDKTFAYPGDEVTYTISYRNYGSVAGDGVQIVDQLPPGMAFVSASHGGSLSGSSVIWNIGTVPGLQNQDYESTTGEVTLVVRIEDFAEGRLCNTASISTTTPGGSGWTSNEYPNNITEVMERNCVDIATRPLYVEKTSDVEMVNPNQIINYTLNFGNQSVEWLNGGRPGVTFAFANNGISDNGDQMGLKIRLYHGADEAYVNYQNYRISYFLQNANTNWSLMNTIYEGGNAADVVVSQQDLVPGTDANGSWNQRMIVQFADQKATTTPHLLRYSGMANRIHEGGTMMLRGVWNMHDNAWASHDWSNDWSADPDAEAPDGAPYFPITNDWTDPYNPDVPINKLHKNACNISAKTINNILVEEWDGYTWRRAFGNGPVPGRDIENVVLTDELPAGVEFGGFTSVPPIGTTTYDPGTHTIRWEIPLLRVSEIGRIEYWVTARDEAYFGGCPISASLINKASITGTNESPAEVEHEVEVTCDAVPPPVPPVTSMTKTITSGDGPYSPGQSISYEISYTNTHGTIAQPDLASSADWTRRSGGSDFTFNGNLQTVGNQSTVMTYEYSHGTNGVLTGIINAIEHAVVGVAMRQTGGGLNDGIYVTFKQNGGAGNVEIRFWNGTTQVGPTASFQLDAGPFNYRIELQGDGISLWLNNMSGSPLVTRTGMTVQAGYAGIINGTPTGQDNWASHTVTNFTTHLDSAFDVQLYDPLPGNVAFSSASGGGALSGGVVEWLMAHSPPADPMLAGETIGATWTGIVDNCESGFISNTAFMRIRGINPHPAAQVNTTCDNVTPVEQLSFTAKVSGKHNMLRWVTSSETDNSHFVIERSEDGEYFYKLGRVEGKGTTQQESQYSFVDGDPYPRISYYRLAQYDNNGDHSYSPVTSVAREVSYRLEILPNPFMNNAEVMLYAPDKVDMSIRVVSVTGKEMYYSENHSSKSRVMLGVDWPAGVYLVQVMYDGNIENRKLVKN